MLRTEETGDGEAAMDGIRGKKIDKAEPRGNGFGTKKGAECRLWAKPGTTRFLYK
jgi:hypothetical protein